MTNVLTTAVAPEPGSPAVEPPPALTLGRVHANPEVVYRPEGRDGAILFDPDTSQVQVINTTGALIWEHLDGAHTVDQLCEMLRQRCADVPADGQELRQQVERFVHSLVRVGLAGEGAP
jgi:hypothetical protein